MHLSQGLNLVHDTSIQHGLLGPWPEDPLERSQPLLNLVLILSGIIHDSFLKAKKKKKKGLGKEGSFLIYQWVNQSSEMPHAAAPGKLT